MAPHSSTLAWKIPWLEEPGRLQSMGSLRVEHDWATSLSLFTFTHWRRKWQPTPVFLPGESQGMEELGGLPSMGLHRVGHDCSDLATAAIHSRQEIWGCIINDQFFVLRIYGWGKEGKLLSRMGFPFRVMKMFGNYLEVLFTQQWDSTNATEFFTLNWLILCHMNFTSI